MSDNRTNWLRGLDPGIPAQEEEREKATKIGANQTRYFLRLVPLTGLGKSISYAHLCDVDCTPDWTRLTLGFDAWIVTVDGQNLDKLLQRIEELRCPEIRQEAPNDPLHARVRDKQAVMVTGLSWKPREE